MIHEMTANECLAALRTTDVGRLAIPATTWPEVFPINYVVDHGAVVFRTATGTKLSTLTASRDVTFEADGYDGAAGEAWSVVVKGRARELTTLHERFEADALPLFPWHDAPKHHLVSIEAVEMTGRRFTARPAAAADREVAAPRRSAGE